jgi:uncharacterized membrane protein YphA (DoxX/SURF4 family)
MQPVDGPFRFTRDFCVVWALLVVPTFCLTPQQAMGPWYSEVAFLVLVPLFATFVLYGPVLLFQQIVGSGSRGRLVGRVLLSVVFVGPLLFGALLICGIYTEWSARAFAFFVTAAATAYLRWRVENEQRD